MDGGGRESEKLLSCQKSQTKRRKLYREKQIMNLEVSEKDDRAFQKIKRSENDDVGLEKS